MQALPTSNRWSTNKVDYHSDRTYTSQQGGWFHFAFKQNWNSVSGGPWEIFVNSVPPNIRAAIQSNPATYCLQNSGGGYRLLIDRQLLSEEAAMLFAQLWAERVSGGVREIGSSYQKHKKPQRIGFGYIYRNIFEDSSVSMFCETVILEMQLSFLRII